MRLTSDQIKPGETYGQALKRVTAEKKNAKRKRPLPMPDIQFEGQPEEPTPPVIGDGKVKSVEELKADFSNAFDQLGGVTGLVAWGQKDPKAFYAIWARLCIPGKREGVGRNGDRTQSLEDMLDELDSESSPSYN